jgi:DNA polymerase I
MGAEQLQEAYNPYKSWERVHVSNEHDLKYMIDCFNEDKPVIGGFDTETTGLHIKKDKAFLMIFGWYKGNAPGRVFTFEPTERKMYWYKKLAEQLMFLVAWNTKYDLHMKANTGYPYLKNNLFEGIALARSVVEAVPARNGGDAMSLKHIGKTYVHPDAAIAEEKIKEVKTKIQKDRVKVLASALKQFDHPKDTEEKWFRIETGAKTTQKWAEKNPGKAELRKIPAKWSKKRVEDFLKDIINEPEELPADLRELYEDWLEEYYPDHVAAYGGKLEASYYDIYKADPEAMIEYAGDDVITMLEYVRKAIPVMKKRDQQRTLKRECDLILPLYRMERVGIRIDREYLENSRLQLKDVIKKKRQRMWDIAGQEFTIGQDELIKKIFLDKWGIEMVKCDKKALKDVAKENPGEPEELSKIIRQLRRLEKWYSTYCVRILKASHYDGRYYTQIAQCSAVSGRVGSDGQQFPKERILTEEGEAYEEEHGEGKAPKDMEIFFPRRAFIPTDRGSVGGFNAIYYLDFSQIELRNQADYTIRVAGGDLNLCRAYMPFKCIHYLTGKTYDYKTPEGRKQWDLEQPNGESAWLMPDKNYEAWTPTDVHSETTHNALVELGYTVHEKYKSYEAPNVMSAENLEVFGRKLDEKGFKKARSKGKTFNFAKNYGGGLRAAMEEQGLPKAVAMALIKGYSEAFPLVVAYQEAIVRKHNYNGYVKNMYDRRYYIEDNNKAYKLANYCVQGTCADMLKECMIEIDALLLNHKTRFIMNIHDELQFEVWAGEEFLIAEILKIMQGHDWHYVPIVSDVEIAKDNWADKKDWEAA